MPTLSIYASGRHVDIQIDETTAKTLKNILKTAGKLYIDIDRKEIIRAEQFDSIY